MYAAISANVARKLPRELRPCRQGRTINHGAAPPQEACVSPEERVVPRGSGVRGTSCMQLVRVGRSRLAVRGTHPKIPRAQSRGRGTRRSTAPREDSPAARTAGVLLPGWRRPPRLGRRKFRVGVQLSGRRRQPPHDEGSPARHCLMQPHDRDDDDVHHDPQPSRLSSAESVHGSKRERRRRGLLSLYNKQPKLSDGDSSSCVHEETGSARRIRTPARFLGRDRERRAREPWRLPPLATSPCCEESYTSRRFSPGARRRRSARVAREGKATRVSFSASRRH